jgi:PKD repeat protein
LEVNFSDASQGNIIAWFWDFGNGSTSTQQNPNFIYAGACIDQTYSPTLTVTDNCGNVDFFQGPAITVFGSPPPQANFDRNPAGGSGPLSVSFIDTSSSPGCITAWSWDFGDGNTSALQSPMHTYSSVSTTQNYDVTLTVIGSEGQTTDFTWFDCVTVTPPEFRRGDCDDSGSFNINDPLTVLYWSFQGNPIPPCLAACDANSDESVSITDAIYLLNWLFVGGPGPGQAVCGQWGSTIECEESNTCP